MKAPGFGFVGVGRVTGRSVPGPDFSISVEGEGRPASEILTDSIYAKRFAGDPDKIEHFVPVQWAQTVPLEQGINEPGLFGNRNTVCAPKVEKWRLTVERLKRAFPDFNRI